MNNFVIIYLLSILDKLHEGFETLFYITIGTTGVVVLLWLTWRMYFSDLDDGKLEAADKFFRRNCVPLLIMAFVFKIVSSLIPNKKEIVEAYTMVEGSKIISSKNGEILAKEMSGRFDEFVDILNKKWASSESATKDMHE